MCFLYTSIVKLLHFPSFRKNFTCLHFPVQIVTCLHSDLRQTVISGIFHNYYTFNKVGLGYSDRDITPWTVTQNQVKLPLNTVQQLHCQSWLVLGTMNTWLGLNYDKYIVAGLRHITSTLAVGEKDKS